MARTVSAATICQSILAEAIHPAETTTAGSRAWLLTRIDEFQLRNLPSLLLGNFFLHLPDLTDNSFSPALTLARSQRSGKGSTLPSLRALHRLRTSAASGPGGEKCMSDERTSRESGVGNHAYLERELHLAPPKEERRLGGGLSRVHADVGERKYRCGLKARGGGN